MANIKDIAVQLPIEKQEPKYIGTLVQNDVNGNILYMRLTEKSDYFNLEEATDIYLNISHSNTLVSSVLCTVVDQSIGLISAIIPDNCLSPIGLYFCDVQVFSGATRVTTTLFSYDVREDLLENSDPSVDPEFPALLQLQIELSEAEDQRVINEALRGEFKFENEYDIAASYMKNNVVMYDGYAYICTQSNQGQLPPAYPTIFNDYWHLIAKKGSDGIGLNYQGYWNSNNNYTVSDLVYYNGDLYHATESNINNVPGSSSSWEVFIALNSYLSKLTTHEDNVTDAHDLETRLASLLDGSPQGTYATLTDLQTAYPTGTTGIYIVAADGHWYYWNGSAWTDGGAYQSTGIADDSVTIEKITPYTYSPLIGINENLMFNSLNPNQDTIDKAFYQFSTGAYLEDNPSKEFKRYGIRKTVVNRWQDGDARTVRIGNNLTTANKISMELSELGLSPGDTISAGIKIKLLSRVNVGTTGLMVILSFRNDSEASTGAAMLPASYVGFSEGEFKEFSDTAVIPAGTTRLRFEFSQQYDHNGQDWITYMEFGAWYIKKGVDKYNLYDNEQDYPLDSRVLSVVNEAVAGETYPQEEIVVDVVDADTVYYYIKGTNTSSNKYLRFSFKHHVEPYSETAIPGNHNLDCWVINEVYEVDRTGDYTFDVIREIVNGGAWETAIKEGGKGDFIGGLAHGDEIMDFAYMLLDGVKVDLNTPAQYKCESIKFVQESKLWRDIKLTDGSIDLTEHEEVARHLKIFDVNFDEGIKLYQEIEWLGEFTTTDTYLCMLPIKRTVDDTDTGEQITDTVIRTDEWQPYDCSLIAHSGIGNQPLPGVTESIIWSEISGISATTKILDKSHELTGSEHFTSNSANYNKQYFDFADGVTAQAGDLWTQTSLYKITINK